MPRTFARIAASLLVFFWAPPSAAGPVTLVSRADPARPSETAGGTSEVAGISADGRYVLFLTDADNVLPEVTDTNLGKDVFLHDRITGTTVLVSHAAGSPTTAGDGVVQGEELGADLSADGRWIAFRSTATDLVAGQTDDGKLYPDDIFLWDRDTDLTILISHRPGLPTQAASFCLGEIDVNEDGSRVAFVSRAPDLVAGQVDASFSPDVFLYDRAAGVNVLVSHTSASITTAIHDAGRPVLSADGNRVVFESGSTNVVAGQIDSNGLPDLFLFDSLTGGNVLVSHAAGAPTTAANNNSHGAQVNADGSRVAYASIATDLVAGLVKANEYTDLFLYERASGTNTLVSHTLSSAVTTGNGFSASPSLSADGRYVAFMSYASNLAAQSSDYAQVIYLYDQVTNTNTLVSRGAASPFGGSSLPRISSDGGWIAFLSEALNLVAGQTDSPFTADVFLWSRASGSLTLVTRSPDSATSTAGSFAKDLRINADGNWIAFSSHCSVLISGIGDHNAAVDVFLYQRATGSNALITSRGGAVSATAGGALAVRGGPSMSNDGRFIAFSSAASNLVEVPDGNMVSDVFLHDRVTGESRLVSHTQTIPSKAANMLSLEPVVSSDGSIVVFSSRATNLPGGPVFPPFFPRLQVYRYSRDTGVVTIVSGSPSELPGEAGEYAVSDDGLWIAFVHDGHDLIPGQVDHNGTDDLFLYNTQSPTRLVSHAAHLPAQAGNDRSGTPSINADGRYIAFRSRASDLVPGRTGIFLYDRVADTFTHVSPDLEGPFKISSDGRWVVFTSSATDVIPGQVDTNSGPDVFLWDRVSGTTQLVSHSSASPIAAADYLSSLGGSTLRPLVLSGDGRWVVFSSKADDLVTEPTSPEEDVFLFDRISGTVTLVSRAADWPAGLANARSTEPNLSADGRFVVYLSLATNLVSGQVDEQGTFDVFLYDRIAGTASLVSHTPTSEVTSGRLGTGTLGTGIVVAPRVSADGAWVAFSSASPDLVAEDHDAATDAFLYANPLPPQDFFTAPPCRIVDTRQPGQGQVLASGWRRAFKIQGLCGIPATARAVAVNLTVFGPSDEGFLDFQAGDIAPTESSGVIYFGPGHARARQAVVPLAYDGTGTLSVTAHVGGNGTVHLIVDLSGWFE